MRVLPPGLLAQLELRILHQALPQAYWADLGLQGFADPYRRFRDADANRPVPTGTPGGVGSAGIPAAG